MAFLPGLLPQQEDTVSGTAPVAPQRQEVNSPVKTPPLSPVAQPVNTFHRAPAFSDPELGKIADALGTLAPAIYNFGDVQQQQQNAIAPGQVAAKLAGAKTEDIPGILQSDPALQGAVTQRLGYAMYGQRVADASVNDLKTQLSTGKFDPLSQNVDDWLAARAKTDLGAKPDPHFAQTYMERFTAGADTIRAGVSRIQSDNVNYQQDNALGGSVTAQINQGLDKNSDPTAVAAGIRQTILTNKAIAGRPLQDQDRVVLQTMQNIADGLATDPNYTRIKPIVEAVLKQPRTAADGTTLGPLTEDSVLGAKANELLAHVNHVYDTRYENDHAAQQIDLDRMARSGDPNFPAKLQQLQQSHPTWFEPGGMIRLNREWDSAKGRAAKAVQDQQMQAAEDRQTQNITRNATTAIQGGAAYGISSATYVDKHGNTQVRSPDDQVKDGVSTLERSIDQQYAGNPEGALNAKVDLYSKVPVKNEQWAKQLQNAPAIGGAAIQAGADLPKQLTDSFKLFQDLRAKNPQLLAKHLDQRSEDFFYTAQFVQDNMGMDPKQALALAHRSLNDPKMQKDLPNEAQAQLNQSAQSSVGSMWRSLASKLPFAGIDPSLGSVRNSDFVVADVKRAAEIEHKALGVPIEQAVADVAPRIQQNYTVINGTAVKTSGANVPSNFPELANAYVNDFYDTNKTNLDKQGIAKTDLTVMNVNGTPNWQILVGGHPAPMSIHGAAFTTQQLSNEQDRLLAAEQQRQEGIRQRHFEPTTIPVPGMPTVNIPLPHLPDFSRIKPTGAAPTALDKAEEKGRADKLAREAAARTKAAEESRKSATQNVLDNLGVSP